MTNQRKTLDRGMSVFTFAMGQQEMYEYLNNNPSVFSRPVDYVNDPRIIAQNDNVVSINATLQIDLTGACNSEYMLGHQYSASGGNWTLSEGHTPLKVEDPSSPRLQRRRKVPFHVLFPALTDQSLHPVLIPTISLPSLVLLTSKDFLQLNER